MRCSVARRQWRRPDVATSSGARQARDADGVPPVIEIWKAAAAHGAAQRRRGGARVPDRPRHAAAHVARTVRGDDRTPVGHYYISDKNADSRFHRFLGISYPNIDDAETRLSARPDRRRPVGRHLLRQPAPRRFRRGSTPLGGRVGIHGFGGRPLVPIDWTEGCIAVSDDDIEYLYDRVAGRHAGDHPRVRRRRRSAKRSTCFSRIRSAARAFAGDERVAAHQGGGDAVALAHHQPGGGGQRVGLGDRRCGAARARRDRCCRADRAAAACRRRRGRSRPAPGARDGRRCR